MANVGAIYTARKLFSSTALKLYVLAAALLGIWRLVWVTRVEQNLLHVMHGGVVAVGQYVIAAFAHTSTLVQLVFLVALVALGSLMVDIVRSAASSNSSRYSF